MTGKAPAPAPSGGPKATRIEGLHSSISGSALVVQIEANGSLDYTASISHNPLQLVIIVGGVTVDVAKDVALTDPHVRRVRIMPRADGARIEFDLDQLVEYKITPSPSGLEVSFVATGMR